MNMTSLPTEVAVSGILSANRKTPMFVITRMTAAVINTQDLPARGEK